MEKNKTLERISTALFLFFIGTLLLLNNFGYISLSFLFTLLLTYWPILIILSGLKLILKSTNLGKYFSLAIDIIFYILIIYLLILQPNIKMNSFFNSKNVNTNNVTDNYKYVVSSEDAISKLNTDLNIGASSFKIEDSAEINNILEVTGDFVGNAPVTSVVLPGVQDEPSKFSFTYPSSNIILRELSNHSDFLFTVKNDAKLGDFQIKLGASDGEILLDTVTIDTFTSIVGAGNLIANFQSIASTPKEIVTKVGAGNVDIYIPKEVDVEISYSVGAGMLKYVSNDITKKFGGLASTGKYESNFNNSGITKINVIVGAGTVNISHE